VAEGEEGGGEDLLDALSIRTSLRLLTPSHATRSLSRALPSLFQELEIMVATKEKAEIQSLSSFDFQYLTQVFLPKKIAQGDWI